MSVVRIKATPDKPSFGPGYVTRETEHRNGYPIKKEGIFFPSNKIPENVTEDGTNGLNVKIGNVVEFWGAKPEDNTKKTQLGVVKDITGEGDQKKYIINVITKEINDENEFVVQTVTVEVLAKNNPVFIIMEGGVNKLIQDYVKARKAEMYHYANVVLDKDWSTDDGPLPGSVDEETSKVKAAAYALGRAEMLAEILAKAAADENTKAELFQLARGLSININSLTNELNKLTGVQQPTTGAEGGS
jgi:hypothetical protein